MPNSTPGARQPWLRVQRDKRLESNPMERDLGKFWLMASCTLRTHIHRWPKRQAVPWDASGLVLPLSEERDCPSLLSLRALGADLGTAVEEKHQAIKKRPKKGYENAEGSRGRDV